MAIPFAVPLATAALSGLAGYAGSRLSGGGNRSSGRSRGGRGRTSTPGGGSLQRVNTLTGPQTQLQNRVINEGLRNLGLLTGGGQNLQAPALPTLPPVPQLTGQTPGYGDLQNLYQGNKYGFEPIEQRVLGQFHREIIPSIANRFAGLGAANTSGFQQALGAAGSDLAERLAALKAEYGIKERGQTFEELSQENRQQLAREELMNRLGLQTNEQLLARQQQQAGQALNLGQLANQRFAAQGTYDLGRTTGLQNLLSLGLQPSFNTLQFPRQPGFGESLASPLLQGLGFGLPSLIGQGISGLGSLFGFGGR